MWVVLVLLAGTGMGLAAAWLNFRAKARGLNRAERLAAGREFDLGLEELACLAHHLAELKLLEMYEAGRIVVSRTGDVTATTALACPEDGFEAEVVRRLGPTRTGDMGKLITWVDYDPPAQALRSRLAVAGLLNDRELVDRMWLAYGWTPVASGAVAVAGVAAFVFTLVRHDNWLFPLVAFPVLFAVALLVNYLVEPPWEARDRYTSLGSRVLSEARAADRREHGPTVDRREHGPMAVALAGLSALPVDHALRICLEASRARARKRAGTTRGIGGGSYSGASCGTGCALGCGTSCGSSCGNGS
ncbi:TIGR04222 domain-containing membrane protein [Streptomyces sp. LS1784]|uniref:TIGR04222 domain-containing membrane protein n=1 Tax=Streptomyces sp. LS1784 TaxID=2851533 RepID=UPI001CCE56D1|nr:TIGR04222 domain-containing membrane protein [Streptomyces sp. LS1784]